MHQSKLESFVESCINVIIGFFVSYACWVFIITPLFNFELNHSDNLAITGIFTVLSVMRSYMVRRFFNSHLHKISHKVAGYIDKWRL